MSGNKHFLDELNYLNQMRVRAARENRDIAPFLAGGEDPDVERLFEGFAFLTGRIREKLEDEFPEIIQSFLNLWWPHYLRPVPAMSILEFQPIASAFSETCSVESGTNVQSVRVDGSRCLFRTSRPVLLHPFTLVEAALDNERAKSSLTLSLEVWPNAGFTETEKGLRLYLSDQGDRAADLYRYLLEYEDEIEAVCYKEGVEVARVVLPRNSISVPDRDSRNALLPGTEYVADGYVALQEFFCFPSGQLFVDLLGLDKIAEAAQSDKSDRIDIQIKFNRSLDFSIESELKLVRINCVPIVNLFSGYGKPIVLKDNLNEYPLLVESSSGMYSELYSVDRCVGVGIGNEEVGEYYRFESFDHQIDPSAGDFYRLRFSRHLDKDDTDRRSAFKSVEKRASSSYLSFVHKKHGGDSTSDTIAVAVDLTCTNGDLPYALDPGGISVSTSNSPEYAKFSNLTKPSRHLLPPLGEQTLWDLVANMSINYTSLLNTDALRTVLRTYDFLGKEDKSAGRRTERILASLEVQHTEAVDHLYKGQPVRGVASTISVSASAFLSAGQAYMFGRVLDQFLGSFAGVNSFHKLTFVERDSDEVYRWPPRAGNRPIL